MKKNRIISLTLASAVAIGTLGGSLAGAAPLEEKTSMPYINGIGDGTFKPEDSVSRAQAAKMIATIEQLEKKAETFPDVADDYWAAGFIGAMQESGFIKGDQAGNFNPESGLTRGEMATIIDRVLNSKVGDKAIAEFTDIDGHWAEGAINRMAQAGIINGYEDGTFKPNNLVKRSEAVKMLNRMVGIMEIDADIADILGDQFTDIETHWAKKDIIASSAKYRYTLEDGQLDVLEDELSIENMKIDWTSKGSTNIVADIENPRAKDVALITIKDKDNKVLPGYDKVEAPIEDGKIDWTSEAPVAEGTNTVTVSVRGVEKSTRFANIYEYTFTPNDNDIRPGEKVTITVGRQLKGALGVGDSQVKVVYKPEEVVTALNNCEGNKIFSSNSTGVVTVDAPYSSGLEEIETPSFVVTAVAAGTSKVDMYSGTTYLGATDITVNSN